MTSIGTNDSLIYSLSKQVKSDSTNFCGITRPVSTNIAPIKTADDLILYKNKNNTALLDFLRLVDENCLLESNKISKISGSTSIEHSGERIHRKTMQQAFDNVIQDLLKKGNKPKSVLTGTSDSFLIAAYKYQVNPFILMGISLIESTYGTSRLALQQNNVCGLADDGVNGISCPSVKKSIDEGARRLSNNMRLKTINSVGMNGNYCSSGPETRAAWVKQVVFFANKILTEYNKLLEENKNVVLSSK